MRVSQRLKRQHYALPSAEAQRHDSASASAALHLVAATVWSVPHSSRRSDDRPAFRVEPIEQHAVEQRHIAHSCSPAPRRQ